MIVASKQSPITGQDSDSDELRIEANKARFLKDLSFSVSRNPGAPVGQGYNAGVLSPLESSILQTSGLTLPAGYNRCIGFYEAEETNEGYFFNYNSNDDHHIYRINGSDGSAQMVYKSKYLDFVLDPQYYITEGRCTLKTVQYFNKATGKTEVHKFLCFTTVRIQPRMLSVEDAIATASFDFAAHPFFDPLVVGTQAIDQVLEKYINLAIATPMDCISFTPQKRFEADKSKQNLLLYKGWQWRVKFIDVWNRESEHGIISERYFTVIGSNCLAASGSMPRCVRLKLPAGIPIVNKIQVEFRTCAGNTDLSVDSDWSIYDTLDKYDNTGNVAFWNRPILNPYQVKLDEMNAANVATPGTYTADQIEQATASLTKYNSDTNTFDYTFCGDKQCQPISTEETNRTNNLVPRTTGSIVGINEGLALSNNKRLFEPLPLAELAKLTVAAVPPSGACDEFQLRKITVYAIIYRPEGTPDSPGSDSRIGWVQYISIPDPEDPPEVLYSSCGGTDTMKFRVTYGRLFGATAAAYAGQVFPDGQNGFVAYLAGTSYAATSTQVFINVSTFGECPVGIINEDGSRNTTACDGIDVVPVQKFEFLVPSGEYVVRLAHHRAKLSEDYQATSGYVTGKQLFSNLANTTTQPFRVPATRSKEMVVDVSAGDYTNHTDIFTIFDLVTEVVPDGDPKGSEYFLYEDQVSRTPISLALLIDGASFLAPTVPIQEYTSALSDHNGFYFCGDGSMGESTAAGGFLPMIERCDPPNPTYPFYLPNWGGWSPAQPYALQICLPSVPSAQATGNYLYSNLDLFPPANRRVISGHIYLCGDANIGIAGVPVVPYHLRAARTDTNGAWQVVAHGRDNTTDRPNTDTLIVSQNACLYSHCDDPCNFKFTHYVVNYIDCQGPPRNTIVADLHIAIHGINKSGPQNGGRYQAGFVFHDGNGRHGYVQTDDSKIIDIPSMLATHRFANSTIQLTIDPSFVAPDWAEYMSIVLTRNLNWDDFFMWSADRIAFVDAAGNEHSSNPTKIRIYYESMLEYLKQNNLNDNAIWQFITDGSTTQTVVGDVIEFYRNGDGTWFDKSILSDIRYDKIGQYIEIDYIADYVGLLSGALFKVIRPKTCVFKQLFMELCPTIKIIGGVAQTLSVTLSYQDSYFLTRQFPVPLYSVDPTDPTKIIKTVNVRYSLYMYEHHSPSDFWGSHCGTRGRIFVKNPYEREQRLGMEIAPSKTLLNKSNFNGLSYFTADDIVTFDEQEWGKITCVVVAINSLLVICEHGNFVIGFNDNTPRLDSSGQLIVPSAGGRFGKPQRRTGSQYGCQMADVSTIRRFGAGVVFLDRSLTELVAHTYSDAVGIAQVLGFKGWLEAKIARQYAVINDPMGTDGTMAFFISGFDPRNGEYFLTYIQTHPQNVAHGEGIAIVPGQTYNNVLVEEDVVANETVCIDLRASLHKGFRSFIPEYYGYMSGFHAGKNMFGMKSGHSWSHHPGTTNPVFNNFFGVQGKKVITMITNMSPEKVKRFQYNEVYCKEHAFIADQIKTESGQLSRIKIAYWEKNENFYVAPFLCDINTPLDTNLPEASGQKAIVDGDLLYGRWMSVRYISQNADDSKYCELSAICTYLIGSEKSAD